MSDPHPAAGDFADRILTIEQAAALTGYSVDSLHRLCSKGKIPYYRPTGGQVRFLESELRAFLLRNRKAADYELAEEAEAQLATGGRKA
jgi:excisionase family DNA binding protein